MEAAGDKLMDELRAAVAAAEELLSVTADQAGPKIQEARARAEELLRNARGHMEGAGRELDSQVRANPWAAVGIAAGVGLILGILLSRK
jgi:ElaB/YqjD/DUF883 family membrane-anchored ribosome-binding protein